MGRFPTLMVAITAANVFSVAYADLAETYTMTEVLDWQRDSEMQLAISATDGDIVPLTYTVIPLTTDLGLNESQTDRGKVNIKGKLTFADADTYTSISGSDVIPYLCCDQTNNSFIQPNMILNQLMSNDPQPAAILLYSQQGQCCGLAGQNLNYQKILSMPAVSVANQVENITTSAAGNAYATISGNFTDMDEEEDGQQSGNNSAVAMSILYSITGIITVLFLVIIGTGAVRAHRYPERYGPRNGLGGRPRQSRAKGLARAVLETLPIVKFGDTTPAKPDPTVELEHAAANTQPKNDERVNVTEDAPRHLDTIPESPTDPTTRLRDADSPVARDQASVNSSTPGLGQANTDNGSVEALGCSICTDDFTLGEDVRVLPCDHRFHPQCVDPWLVNVSGTCPLWYVIRSSFLLALTNKTVCSRLDLRPEHDQREDAEDGTTEPPPLGGEGNGSTDTPISTRRRTRFLDLARLRHASVEQRIEGLRQYRNEHPHGPSTRYDDESHGHAGLTDRLRDTFHIRTREAHRGQSP